MGEKFCDSTLLDKALIFAVNAHKNTERRGKGFPYITHPIEVVSIVSTITGDQKLLAAAALHDVVEDTPITIEEIRKEFGDDIARIVESESDKQIEGQTVEQSWLTRKKQAIERLANASKESKIVALGDKLSNMRAIYRDYNEIGDKLWSRFHESDPKLHEWHYRGLADSLKELKDTEAYKEFVKLINDVFKNNTKEFELKVSGKDIYLSGFFDKVGALKIEKTLSAGQIYMLDFSNVDDINFVGLRCLIRMKQKGIDFAIRNVSESIFEKIANTGVDKIISITKKPIEFDVSNTNESGDGFTSRSYFCNDDDSMVKVYLPFIPITTIEREKRCAKEALLMGIPTPLCGDIVQTKKGYGVIFEKIHNKKSFAKILSEEPERIEYIAKQFAALGKNLHETSCNTAVFPDIKDVYIRQVYLTKLLDEKEKEKVINFIKDIPNKLTCLHGDFHIGNAIVNEKGDKLFIDMGDFAYGDPCFDIGALYFVCHTNDEMTMKRFHCDCKTLNQFYDLFAKYYFDLSDVNKLKEMENIIKPFAALKMISFANQTGALPFMNKLIKEWLIKFC